MTNRLTESIPEPLAQMLKCPSGNTDAPPSEEQAEWRLCLYVLGRNPQSETAIRNLQRLCETHLAGRYQVEVIDLLVTPQLSREHQIVVIPTLVRKLPEPIRKIIGDLSDTKRTLVGLELEAAPRTKGLPMRYPRNKECTHADLAPEPARLRLQLYVSGATRRSSLAIANIKAIGESRLHGQYDLEVIDACQQAELLRNQQIVVLPTLIKHLPPPIRRMVGDLSDKESVLLSLGLDPNEPDETKPRSNDPNADG
jgi:circadian clock protein KaiB